MHFSNSLLMLAAMGAGNAAGRATHRHRHADLHKARDVGDIVHAKIDGVDVSWTNTYDGGAGDDVSVAAPPPSQPTTPARPDQPPAVGFQFTIVNECQNHIMHVCWSNSGHN